MGDSHYKASEAGFRAMMLDKSIGDAMVAAAERGADYARSISPVLTGDYQASFHVRPAIVGSGQRAGAILENTSDHAFEVEYQDDYRILQRTVDQIEKG